MIFCPNCGKSIPADSKFCTFCGTAIPSVDQTQISADPPRVQTTPLTISKPYVPVVKKNEFYKNIGFWGAIILLAGFFLPYASTEFMSISFYDLIFSGGPVAGGTYLWLVFPISGAILILQGLTNMLPSGLANLFKLLPLLTIILLVVVILQDPNSYGMFGDWDAFVKTAGIGMWATLAGSFLVLFFNRK